MIAGYVKLKALNDKTHGRFSFQSAYVYDRLFFIFKKVELFFLTVIGVLQVTVSFCQS